MDPEAYDDPKMQKKWIDDERAKVLNYLEKEGLTHGGIPDEPDWLTVPYLAIWRVASPRSPDAIGWWAVSGDVPTDYVSSGNAADARAAMLKFAGNWSELARRMLEDEPHPDASIGTPDKARQYARFLSHRAGLLAQFVSNDTYWN